MTLTADAAVTFDDIAETKTTDLPDENSFGQVQADLERFRALFGDDRGDYGVTLQRYYQEGPAPQWDQSFVSA